MFDTNLVAAGLILLLVASCSPYDDDLHLKQRSVVPEELKHLAETRKSLTGTWRLVDSQWDQEKLDPNSDIVGYKIFYDDRFAVIRFNPDSLQLVGAIGGTFDKRDDQILEYVEYNTWDSTLIVAPQSFKYDLKYNSLTLEGEINGGRGNYSNIKERYVRVARNYDHKHPLMGVWRMTKLTNDHNGSVIRPSEYEETIKFIVPDYFYRVSFRYSGAISDLSFGRQKLKEDYYIQEMKFHTSDQDCAGKEYQYIWKADEYRFRQTGSIDPDAEVDYALEEYYHRASLPRIY